MDVQGDSSSTSPVRRRRVFYIPGYDPIHPRRYRELYRKEGADQARISGYEIALAPKRAKGAYGWHVASVQDGQAVDTDVEVLVWSDIVRNSMSNSIPATYLQLLRTAWTYITSGALRRLMWLRKGPVIAALYPVGMLLVQLGVAIGLGLAVGAALRLVLALGLSYFGADLPLPGLVLWGIAAPVIWFVLRWFRARDGRFFAYYLMHDYAYSARWNGANPPALEARMAEFGDAIARALTGADNTDSENSRPENTGPENIGPQSTDAENTDSENTGPENTGPENTGPQSTDAKNTDSGTTRPETIGPLDEVLIVGHSSGAHLAVSILADLVRAGRVPADGPALGFLSLGQVVPMVSFLRDATRLRADLAYLSAREELTWVDVTAPGDGCAFALCDPVAVSGVAPPDQKGPLVLSAAFTQTLSPERWRELRWRFFRLHFQYLCAFDRPGDYDYFRITAGPQTLADRFRGRPHSKSRITRAASKYTTVTPR